MERIFSYTDHEGDLTEFWAESNEDLVIKNTRDLDKKIAAVRMYSSEARRLRDALNYWLGDPAPEAAPEPVYGPDSLIGQLITQAVAAEVAKVLPLHRSPFATQADPGLCHRCGDQRPSLSLVHQCSADPEPLRCDYDCSSCNPDDPEPHDVGHPVYEDARPHPTVPVGGWWCTGCKHGWGEHTAGYCWGGGTDCYCTAYRPEPVPVTESDKVWGEQGTPPKPVALECICDKHNHRPVDRPGSPATCVYRDCECKYRSAP